MRRVSALQLTAVFLFTAASGTAAQQPASAPYTLEQVKSYPFPSGLTASATGSRIAWAFDEQGRRNVYVAEGPAFSARQLTQYAKDDGQELTSIEISGDGRWVVYVRGGEHGSNWERNVPINPSLDPVAPRVQVWAVPFEGGTPKVIADGDLPSISPRNDVVAFQRDGAIWTVPIDGSAAAKRLFTIRGTSSDPRWSPDGSRLAFVSSRGDHAFIGVYSNDSTPIRFLAPSTSSDGSPRWSADGKRIAFVRRPGSGGVPDSILARRHTPWGIWTADATSGAARRVYQAPRTLRASVPGTAGGTNLRWAADDRLLFVSYADGWPHLYSIRDGAAGGPQLLTPGNHFVEFLALTPDGRRVVFSGNAGADADDIDRRHVAIVDADGGPVRVLTPGTGIESGPVVTGDGTSIVFTSATSQRPPLPAVIPLAGGAIRLIAEERLPRDFPAAQLVVPKSVVYRAPDGVAVHAQLFERPGGAARKPAIVYIHGGPSRQMLLGWHYGDYYANAYAMNQYLASLGYVVLAVNYRLGIGYGYDFQNPAQGGSRGAAEYQDIKAGGQYLRRLPQVDAARIGVYGGSYGGYLTALALGRDSDLFAAGVDIHGVHDYTGERAASLLAPRYEKAPDLQRALDVAWRSSPVASVATWRSPVLLIHGDDDRNVRFSQSVDLVQRLAERGVEFEEIVIPDETHHWMLHRNALLVNHAIAEYFGRKLLRRSTVSKGQSP